MMFLAPWLLLGTVLGGLPIVIHLLNRPRYQVEPWGAMRFLEEALNRRSKRIRIQHILLMILRALVLVLFALALSRPVWRAENIGAAGQPTTLALVFDGSYTLRQGEHRAQAFERARQTALELVDEMREQDNALVIWAGNRPRALTPRPVFNKAELRRLIETLEPGWEKADLPRAVEHAQWMLEASTLPRHRVVVLSDGRAGTWVPDDPHPWRGVRARMEDRRLPLHLYAVLQAPDEDIHNLAITDLRSRFPLLDVHREATFVVDLHNHGPEPIEKTLTLSVGETPVDRRVLTLPPGRHTETFVHRFEEAGTFAVRAELSEDDLPEDNLRVLAVEVLRRVPVLIVEGADEPDPFASDATLLHWALEAGSQTGPDAEETEALFAVTRIPATEFDVMGPAQLRAYQSVIFANVTSISRESARALEAFVRNGGGVLLGLGSRVEAAAWNDFADAERGWIPAELLERVEAADESLHPVFPAGVGLEVLDQFDVSQTRTLRDARVERHWRTRPVEGALVAAQVGEDPLLTVRRVGEGMTAMWTGTLGLEWGNLAATPDFVPLMQNLVFQLSSRVVPPINLAQGEPLVYSWSRAVARLTFSEENPRPEAPAEVTLVRPDGSEIALPLIRRQGEQIATAEETFRPGIYTLRAGDLPERVYAVNVPAEAGDLTGMTFRDGQEADTAPIHLREGGEGLREAIRAETGIRDLTTWLAMLALILLVSEMWVAWRSTS
ncbi:MAG: BatA domain-containing protein [Verrucomicrobia bacterium]|nr:BatA domain-containing protein [Verrucomicrobiota bacterium]MCH8513204.1 BatA domain-containing protein [Kiritimatiellia bacterium]